MLRAVTHCSENAHMHTHHSMVLKQSKTPVFIGFSILAQHFDVTLL